MIGAKENSAAEILTAPIELPGGYSGLVALRGSRGNQFSRMDWTRCLAKPERLLADAEKIVKQHRCSRVVLKEIDLAEQRLKVIIKRHRPGFSPAAIFRSIRPGRALRNFKTAVNLLRLSVPTVWPLAAIRKKKFIFTTESIYITEYEPDSANLYTFAQNHFGGNGDDFPEIKADLSAQAVWILASLHNLGMWHRDSKATNFVVCKDVYQKQQSPIPETFRQRGYHLKLADMDGIKRYLIRRRGNQLRGLWLLAASVMGFVDETDFLRAFTLYSRLTSLAPDGQRDVYRQLALLAKEKADTIQKRRLKHKTQPHRWDNILILKPSSLGDIILALPALSAIRKSFPKARISWLVRSEFAPILENNTLLDRVIRFDRKYLGTAWRDPKALGALIAFIKDLRKSRFDVVFDLQGLLRTALLGFLSGCKNRFGMAKAREFAYLFYNHIIPQTGREVHLVDYYKKIIEAAGAKPCDTQFVLPENPAAKDRIKKLLAENHLDGQDYAVFVPSSARPNKCWPIENFAARAERLSARFAVKIIAVGTAAEKPVTQHLAELTTGRVIDLAGSTDIAELVELVRNARFVVSNDTGPGHIAGALGVPLALIFGHTNPARVGAYGRPATAAAVEPEKRGIHRHSTNPLHKIQAVTVEQVYRVISTQLGD